MTYIAFNMNMEHTCNLVVAQSAHLRVCGIVDCARSNGWIEQNLTLTKITLAEHPRVFDQFDLSTMPWKELSTKTHNTTKYSQLTFP